MNRIIKTLGLILFLTIAGQINAKAAVSFKINIPTIPFTPIITSVEASPTSGTKLKVVADINGDTQMEACCDGVCTHQCEPNCNFDCGMADYTGAVDPRVTPNPTCIPSPGNNATNAAVCNKSSAQNPKVFFYMEGVEATKLNAPMTYNADSGKFEAEIDYGTLGAETGDNIIYYVIASDNRGNVVSQSPDPTKAPCTTSNEWDPNFQTPAIDNCSVSNSWTKCNFFTAGTPTCSDVSRTINDPMGDTCGKTGTLDPSATNLDIIGLAAGAGTAAGTGITGSIVCSDMRLNGTPPVEGEGGDYFKGYLIVFFNPDIPDPNPSDVHMINAFAVTYVPGISGTDASLVRVLWNGDCVTDPNTSDPLGCRLIIGTTTEKKVQVVANDKNLRFIATNSLPNSKTLLGAQSATTRMLLGSVGVDINSTTTPFWIADISAGIALVAANQKYKVGDVANNPPGYTALKCKRASGSVTDFSNPAACKKQTGETSAPANNKCMFTVTPSSSAATTTKYKIYQYTSNNAVAALATTAVKEITSGLTANTDVDFTFPSAQLDGKPYYYFLTSTNDTLGENSADKSTKVPACTVEDWVAPTAPTVSKCETPDGQEKKCACSWTSNLTTDPSISGFYVSRGADVNSMEVKTTSPVLAGAGINDYSWNDPDEVTLGSSYTYGVAAEDTGGNKTDPKATTANTVCRPEDKKAPEKITPSITLKPGEFSVNVNWDKLPDADMLGGNYEVFKCQVSTSETTDCQTEADYTSMGIVTQANVPANLPVSGSALCTEEKKFCFWIKACDNCVADGTCPVSNKNNCTALATMKPYRMCLNVTSTVDDVWPAFPGSQVADNPPPASGGECTLSWTKTTRNEDDPPTTITDPPDPKDLMGYQIYRASGNPCTVAGPRNSGYLAGTVSYTSTTFSDKTVTNGTKYCYRVYAYDASSNWSSKTEPAQSECTPADTVKPDRIKDAEATFDADQGFCTINWTQLTEVPVSYLVYRCDKTAASCAFADFAAQDPVQDVATAEDSTVSEDKIYTYCIVGRDAAGNPITVNAAALYDGTSPSDSSNCAICNTGSVVALAPPTAIAGASYPTATKIGVSASWTSSVGETDATTYKLYLCKDNTTAISGCFGASWAAIPKTGNHSVASPALIADAGITDTDAKKASDNMYNIGVTATDAGTTTAIAYSSAKVEVDVPTTPSDPCATNPSDCTTVNFSGQFVKNKVETCAYDATTCKTGAYKMTCTCDTAATIEVYDSSSGAVVKTVHPVDGGACTSCTDCKTCTVPLKIHPTTEAQSGKTYKIRVKYASGAYSASFKYLCASATDPDCQIDLLTTPAAVTAGGTINISGAKMMPNDTSGAGGPEIGNVDGNLKVDLTDLGSLKLAFGTKYGDTCYRAWADLNQDGKVTIVDLGLLKLNFGKKLSVAPTPPYKKGGTGDTPLPSSCAK